MSAEHSESPVWFREKGRSEFHAGSAARVAGRQVGFQTTHAVSPKSIIELELSVPEHSTQPRAVEAEVTRVDVRPDGFWVEGAVRQ